jgi:hypothetical protein
MSEEQSFKSLIKDLESKDFDGHTSFKQMSAEQKLLWLSNAASFVIESRSLKNQKLNHKISEKS